VVFDLATNGHPDIIRPAASALRLGFDGDKASLICPGKNPAAEPSLCKNAPLSLVVLPTVANDSHQAERTPANSSHCSLNLPRLNRSRKKDKNVTASHLLISVQERL